MDAADVRAQPGYFHEQVGMIVISESTTEPMELEEAAENVHARDDGDGSYFEASLILRLIKVGRQLCEEETELSLVLKTLEVSQRSFYPACIELPGGPVRSIVSVTYVDSSGVDTVVAADQYRLSTSSRMAILRPAYNVTWPSARCDVDSVRVRYTAGYSTDDSPPREVPEPIRQAMHLFIAHYYNNRDAVDIDSVMELPLGARYLIGKYRQGLGV